MVGKEHKAETVLESLKSEEAQSLIQALDNCQFEYNASLKKLKKLAASVEKARQNHFEADDGRQEELKKALDDCEKAFDEMLRGNEQRLDDLIKATLDKCTFFERLKERIGVEELKATETESQLLDAALGDIKEKLKQLRKLKQDSGKKGHNPAQPTKSSKRIDRAGLVEEIVAVLAEADKVKTTKKDIKESGLKAQSAANEPARYRLRTLYAEKVCDAMFKQFNYQNINEVPRLEKILLNMGLGDVKDDAKKFNAAVEELKTIAGQKPVITKAKKSIANFKLRQGMNIGAKVTLRGARMYEFLDKLISIALPRVRDFKGLNPHSFDGRGNYALGVKEQLIFPEIKYDKVDKVRGFDICIVTTAKTDEEAKALLTHLGLPFRG